MASINTSIIICTRNRAASLAASLASFAHIRVPSSLKCELIVVDNASTDSTRSVVEAASIPEIAVRYFREERVGKSAAINRAVAEARGELLVWSDDDIRPSCSWLEAITWPILHQNAQACAGRIDLPAHLQRAYLLPIQIAEFAISTPEFLDNPPAMIGANMAFHRDVLKRVPKFDLELGPGSLGFSEDELFSKQLFEAGYKIVGVHDAAVEHHFDSDRLGPRSLRQRRWQQGKADAYIAYHWAHDRYEQPLRLALLQVLKLAKCKLRAVAKGDLPSGPPSERECLLLRDLSFFLQFHREAHRPRNYEPRGLVKLRGTLA